MTRERIAAAVTAVVTEILPAVPATVIAGDRDLESLGADSVERVEIVLALRDRLGISEPLSSFNDVPDLDRLVDLLTLLTER